METQNFETLHEAVRCGCVEAVCHFLQNNANVNEKDSAGNTPLLLAICIKHEEIYNTIVRYLIENGADVNMYNKGFTPLYNAVFYNRTESVKMLLEAGAWLRPCYQSELHLLAENGECTILQLILNDNRCTTEIINKADENGRTAVYIAALNGNKNVLTLLIKHGGDIGHVSDGDHTVVDVIFEQFANPVKFFIELFDSYIEIVTKPKDRCSYNIDFRVLTTKKCPRQMDVISNLLVAASDEEKTEVLQHPLIELYLILKWSRICHFFYLWISIYVVFAVSMALYVFLIIHRTETFMSFQTGIRCILIFSSAGLLGHAILQCILVRRYYLQRYEMWMNLICTTLSLVVAASADGSSGTDSNDIPNWVLHVTSIAVLLAWIELMLLIGTLPTFGYYALMFTTVFQNVIKVLLAFFCLVIGFALSFSIQFHNYEQFNDPWRALVKTIVMMMGEYEYGDLFADNIVMPNRLPTMSRFIFLLFIILTSIVLMNLMVGLAVSDIQGLQMVSQARKLEKQAEFLCQLEKVITSKQLNSKYVPEFIKRVFVKNSFIGDKYELKGSSAEFVKTTKIPRKVIDSIIAIAKARKELGNDN